MAMRLLGGWSSPGIFPSPLNGPLPCSGLDISSSLRGASSEMGNQLCGEISQIPSSFWLHLMWAVFGFFLDVGDPQALFPPTHVPARTL